MTKEEMDKMSSLQQKYHKRLLEAKLKEFERFFAEVVKNLDSLLEEARENYKKEFYISLPLIISMEEFSCSCEKYSNDCWYYYNGRETDLFRGSYRGIIDFCKHHRLDHDWGWEIIHLGKEAWKPRALLLQLNIRISPKL